MSDAPTTTSMASRTELMRRTIPGAENLEAVLYLLSLPHGAAAPAHRHPGIGVGYVLEGVYESQYEGEELKRFPAGTRSTILPTRRISMPAMAPPASRWASLCSLLPRDSRLSFRSMSCINEYTPLASPEQPAPQGPPRFGHDAFKPSHQPLLASRR